MIAEKRKHFFSFLPTSCAAKKVKCDGKATCRHLGCHCPSVVDSNCLLGNLWKTFGKVMENPPRTKKRPISWIPSIPFFCRFSYTNLWKALEKYIWLVATIVSGHGADKMLSM